MEAGCSVRSLAAGLIRCIHAVAHRHTQYDGRFWGDEDRDGGAYLDCRDDPSMVLILTVLVVCTTVIINGVTMPALMSYLKMTDVPPERRHMLADAVRYSRKSRVSHHHTHSCCLI